MISRLFYGTLVFLCVACAAPGMAAPDPATSSFTASAWPEIGQLDLSQARTVAVGSGNQASIRYSLTAPGVIRIRLVDSRTPGIIWRTLVDWGAREAGQNADGWDGRDGHGDPLDPSAMSVMMVAEPDRTRLGPAELAVFSAAVHPEHKHFTHPREQCGDLSVRLGGIKEGALVQGQVAVQAYLIEPLGMPDDEYHVVFYLDGRQAWDGRVGEPKFGTSFDSNHLTKGDHWLAVTFNDLHDHAGSDWVRFTVENP